jgi:hypothetical protein
MAMTSCRHCAHEHVCHGSSKRDIAPKLVRWLQSQITEPDPLELGIVSTARAHQNLYYGRVLDKIQELEGIL